MLLGATILKFVDLQIAHHQKFETTHQIISFSTSYCKLINIARHTDLIPTWGQHGEGVATANVVNKKLKMML